MKIKQRGFTLIELLVVIAIIGLLSTMAVVSLNSARGKARDARRLSDIKQLSTILEMEATEGSIVTALTGCGIDGLTTACSNTGAIATQFPNFLDPSTPGTACNCSAALAATCAYGISSETGLAVATVGNYQICFYVEEGAGSIPKGKACIRTGGLIKCASGTTACPATNCP